MTNPIIDWHGCYRGGWKNEIVPDAFQHPAKYARRLIARIYDHLMDESLVTRGDKVIDPFGGVALGALDAMRVGLDWTGVELEPKFHALGSANIALWNARYSTLPRWGSAQLLNGDSRNLAALVRAAHCAVSSPPYAETRILEYEQTMSNRPRVGDMGVTRGYGAQDGNLGNLREGDFSDAIAYRAAISSPPYEEARIGESSGAANVGHNTNYGQTDGQLGSMSGGDYADALAYRAAVSSPPYEHESYGGGLSKSFAEWRAMNGRDNNKPGVIGFENGYGETPGQIGGSGHETFWLASRQIVSQVHSVLAPGGVAVWVVKDFVRNKARVPFCDQWQTLCEHLGFEHLYTARAWLVEDNGTQLAHDGNHRRHVKERKSFFRRLNEKNGGPRIDWEEVIFMRKS